MSFDNTLGVMNDGVLNESGDVYLRFTSMGLLGGLNNIPVPPAGGPGNVPGGLDVGMTPLSYWRKTRFRREEGDPWRDSTMGTPREEFLDELDEQRDDSNGKRKI